MKLDGDSGEPGGPNIIPLDSAVEKLVALGRDLRNKPQSYWTRVLAAIWGMVLVGHLAEAAAQSLDTLPCEISKEGCAQAARSPDDFCFPCAAKYVLLHPETVGMFRTPD